MYIKYICGLDYTSLPIAKTILRPYTNRGK
jgi:hypothetical protein